MTHSESIACVAAPYSAENQHRQSASYTDTKGTNRSEDDAWLRATTRDTVGRNPVTVSEGFADLAETDTLDSLNQAKARKASRTITDTGVQCALKNGPTGLQGLLRDLHNHWAVAQDLDTASHAAKKYNGRMKVDASTAIFQLGTIAGASRLRRENADDATAALQHLNRLSSNLQELGASCGDFLLTRQLADNAQGEALAKALNTESGLQLLFARSAGDDAFTYKAPSTEIGAQAANGDLWRQAA
jgi:hypothetical protein